MLYLICYCIYYGWLACSPINIRKLLIEEESII